VVEDASVVANTSVDFRFAFVVAALGQLLRGGKCTGEFRYDDVLKFARDRRGNDSEGLSRQIPFARESREDPRDTGRGAYARSYW
jgi:hypothetical protein